MEALRHGELTWIGEMVIFNMRNARPAYNLIENNCQTFATALLDAIKIGTHREFATSYAVWKRAIGAGTIVDLFKDKAPEQLPEENPQVAQQAADAGDVVEAEMPKLTHQNTMQVAQQVMDDNTTKLDTHEGHHHLFGSRD
jgi:hypothetical protein